MRHFKPLPHLRAFEPRPLSVLICSRQEALRRALQAAIAAESDMRLHAAVETPRDAVRRMARDEPDVILLDVGMARRGWDEAIVRLTRPPANRPVPPAVIVLSAYFDEEFLYALFAAGAKGYLLIEEWPDDVLSGVRRMIWGIPLLSDTVLQSLVPPRAADVALDRDQTLLLRMVARGFTDSEIAYHLDLDVSDVAAAMGRMWRLADGAGNRADLVAWAWRYGRM